MARISRYFEKLAIAIAGGQSIRNAADSVGCAESTAYRTVRTPEFRQRVGEIRTSATDAAVGKLSKLAVDAVEVLREIMEDPDQPPAPRVTAAAKVLAVLGPMSELCELRQRLDAIEAAAKTGLKVAG